MVKIILFIFLCFLNEKSTSLFFRLFRFFLVSGYKYAPENILFPKIIQYFKDYSIECRLGNRPFESWLELSHT
jgi:hypothetical protein